MLGSLASAVRLVSELRVWLKLETFSLWLHFEIEAVLFMRCASYLPMKTW